MADLQADMAGQFSRWRGSDRWEAADLPLIGSQHVAPILPGTDLWDCWPLQHEDGSTALIDGAQYWFFLSAPCFPDPAQRHLNARIRLMRYAQGRWEDLGDTLDPATTPGHAEWAGSCVLHDDGARVTLFFTAAGRRGEGPSFEQRIFACEGELIAGQGPGKWLRPCELFAADGAVYLPAIHRDGAPGTIKAFRDPAWFRDPADGAQYLLFTGSAGWSDDAFNGLVGHAAWTGEAWQLRPPLIEAVGVNNELERPHMLVRDGLYYLFWSTQRHTFSTSVVAGPNGLYAAFAERFGGPWTPVNNGGLVAANPAAEPTQSYSWWVTGEGEVWSFVDLWGMEGRALADHPELARQQFGGTPAPRFQLEFAGPRVSIEGQG